MAEDIDPTHAAAGRVEGASLDRAALLARTLEELRFAWEAYAARLPEGHEAWPRGAAYVRESSSKSMTRESPLTQITWILDHYARQQVWVDRGDIYFDNVSATSAKARPAFNRMYDATMRGVYTVVAASRSDRLFRNAAEAREYRSDLRSKGVEFEYSGRLVGDNRSISSWMSESQQDLMDEFWARKCSETVGVELQRLSAAGKPLGRIPEGYAIGERAGSYQGVPGKILSYVRNEPLASIIVQGKVRFLEGASYAGLAAWSATTELEGLTPSGRPMNWGWWRNTLGNPKYAGFQMPSEWQGFRPGKDGTPKRPRRKNLATDLVPCMLPALYPFEDWKRIVEIGRARRNGAKARKRYRVCLLSSVAVDDRCGHRMGIHQRRGDRVYMACQTIDPAGRHSNPVRTDLAERHLEEICAQLRLDDPALLEMIGQELERLSRRESEGVAFRPDPEIGRLHAALATLGDEAPAEVRGPLLSRLEKLIANDEIRRSEHSETTRRFRVSVEDLRHWSAVWASADTSSKNDVLKSAGLRVRLGRSPGVTRGPVGIVAIEADDPVFSFALAVALRSVAFQGSNLLERRNAMDLVTLPPELRAVVDATRSWSTPPVGTPGTRAVGAIDRPLTQAGP